MTEKDPKKYEIGFLAKAEADREEIAKILADNKAEITDNGNLAFIKLAYPIKKQNSAYFGYIQFSALPDIIKKMRDGLRLSQQILRFMIISSPVVKSENEGRMRLSVGARKTAARPEASVKKAKPQPVLSNEALEKKLEEILK